VPEGSKEVDNLFGVDSKGNVLWRVQSVKDAFCLQQNTPYISMEILDKQIVQVTSFFGMRFFVEISSGKLIDKECIRW
jgi:hypothetical protein